MIFQPAVCISSVLDWVNSEDKSVLDGVAAGVYSVPGDPEGCIDFQAITGKLKAMDYSGWIARRDA